MMIMPGNNASGIVHYWAGVYPDKIGWLNAPLSWKNPPHYMTYAVDNGCFVKWNKKAFKECLWKVSCFHSPLFIVVPDVVGDAEATVKQWYKWHKKVSKYGKLAFACQDGMEPQDVPKEAHCCFIGGTTEWKINNAHKFKGVCDWLHIGRVNYPARIYWAEKIGADSIDGTAFFRSPKNKQMLTELIEGSPQKCFQF